MIFVMAFLLVLILKKNYQDFERLLNLEPIQENNHRHYTYMMDQEAINKACKYHPETKQELQKLVDDPKVNLGEIDTSKITNMDFLFALSSRSDFSGIENWNVSTWKIWLGCFLVVVTLINR